MGWKGVGVLAAILWTVPAASTAQSVTIRTYNNYGVATDDLAAARPYVDAVFAHAGIEVSWIDCWYGDKEVAGASARCRQPLQAHEVILRLQAAHPQPGKRYVSMGFALVNIAEGVPFLATVFPDLVRSVSRDAHLDFGLLLGRAMAHEIGHLLLDTNRHADRGLMRAGWSHVELRQNVETDWAFGADEIAVIRAAAVRRNGL
ncbi:MAG: hypothetical protein EHM55_13165 [Acidobacteria bacterium]|nr:MAG: hypothetical protein EHM55_13165 [Acidobacteriota bacterium]